MQSNIITVIGNVGAGKSSALRLISERFVVTPIQADTLFQDSDPFAKDFLTDMHRWAFTNELWMTHARAKMIKKAVSEADTAFCVVDSGLLMSWVYAYSHTLTGAMSTDEWELYQALFDDLSDGIFNDSYVINLSYSHQTLLDRITKRGRDYELEHYTVAYLEQLQKGLDSLLLRLEESGTQVITITEELVVDFVNSTTDAQKMVEIIENHASQLVRK